VNTYSTRIWVPSCTNQNSQESGSIKYMIFWCFADRAS